MQFNASYQLISRPVSTVLCHLKRVLSGRENRCVFGDKVRQRTYGTQDHNVTINTRIYQSVNQKGNEAPTLTPPWFKASNLVRCITVVNLCAKVPQKLPYGQSHKPIKL